MSMLNSLLQAFAWSIVIVPVATLIVGVPLSYFLPFHRKVIGILLIAFGSFGAAMFLISLYIAIAAGRLPVTIAFVALVAVELATMSSGIISLTHKRKPKSP